ncbi:MAG TPA: lipoyl domain-containing protein [Ktedonobacteraceae bacterium]|nr:lipoyl domain-containing protein [Ktedonobacteraceae bacterium]
MDVVEMPRLGSMVEEGKVLCWVKIAGDPVEKGDPLAEIETDKVNVEVTSPAAGVLRAIFVPEGETVPVGTAIALIGMASESLPDPGLLPRQPVVVYRRRSDRANRGSRASFAGIGWLEGLLGLLFIVSVIFRQGWDWLTAVIVGVLLISFGFLLGVVVQRWRSK